MDRAAVSAALEGLALSRADREFLVKVGLPQSAAGGLNFDPPQTGSLPTVNAQLFVSAFPNALRVIGFDGVAA